MRTDKDKFHKRTCKKCKNLEDCKGSRKTSCARTRIFQPELFEVITGIKREECQNERD